MSSITKNRTRIACIGDSITYGFGIVDTQHDSYPAVLQRLLGADYDVRGFGVNGATVMGNSLLPYSKSEEYVQRIEFFPDIVVIELGANDIMFLPYENFIDDLKRLVESYLTDSVQVFICSLTPILHVRGLEDRESQKRHEKIQALIKQVADDYALTVIDIWSPLNSAPAVLQEDQIHPTKEGANIIARVVYETILEHPMK